MMPRLSCEQCHLRKTKCDKQVPCSACQNAGIHCNVVHRARRPRGRSGMTNNKHAALESRVSRLEALLLHADPNTAACADTDGNTGFVQADPPLVSPQNGKLGKFVAPDFWVTLSQEVAAIRETLEESDDQHIDETAPGVQNQINGSRDNGCRVLFAQVVGDDATCGTEPVARVREALLDVYEARIDTVFRPIHWPTVSGNIRTRHGSTIPPTVSASDRALEYAIYHLAVCSLSEDECLEVLLDTKTKSLHQYHAATETYISRARTLQSPDILGLQAFVIYLQAIRTCKGHALNWTLLAVAVRLASTLGLGAEDPVLASPLALEARRRLWYSICLMDTQATLDRGATPLIHAKDLGMPPRNINDSEVGSDIASALHRPALTDMSFCTMTFEAMVCFKKICALNEVTPDGWDSWDHKLKLLNELEETFSLKYFAIEHTDAQPIGILLKMSAKSIAADMRLLLRRPPYRQKHNVVPPWDDFDSMATATEVLERHMDIDAQQLASWAWKEWTPWYALAVALAELYRNPFGTKADKTYAVACDTFRRYSSPPTDLDQGMLWKPIAKLLQRVTKLRAGMVCTMSAPLQTTSSTSSTERPSSPNNSGWPKQVGQYAQLMSENHSTSMSSQLAGWDSWIMDDNPPQSLPDGVLQVEECTEYGLSLIHI